MKSTVVLLLSCVMVCVNAMELEESLGKIANVRTGSGNIKKEPRLFLVTTASTTRIFRTTSLCYCTTGTGTTVTGACKRKRSILDESFVDPNLLTPSKSSPLVDSGFDDEDNFLEADWNHRAARQNFFNFLLYWATTTSTSTSTSITGTVTLSVATGGCTLSGMSACTVASCP